MITIGFDAKRAFMNFSGLGNYSRSLIRALATFYPHHRYVLFTPPYTAHPSHKQFKHTNITISTPTGAGVLNAPLWRAGGLGFSTALRREQIQIFHGLSGALPYGISHSLPMIVTVHDLIFLRYPQYYKSIDRLVYEKKLRHACQRANIIVAISKQTKEDLIQFFGIESQKITVVYQGCDPQFYRTPSADIITAIKAKYQLPEQFILSVGTVEERKNLVTVIKALAMLPQNLHLVVLGQSTPYIALVNREIERQKLSSRVRIIHNALFSDLPAIYALSQLLVYPSLFEGFGIPVLEGLSLGIPVVTSNRSSLPEVGGDAAAYIDPLNVEEMAQTVHNILENSSIASDMVNRGFRHAHHFREEEIASNMHHLYTQLIS